MFRVLLAAVVWFAMLPGAGRADHGMQEVSRGAVVPWTTYEAESVTTNGTVLGPTYSGFSAAREASGRRCVRLSEPSQYIEFKADADAQALVVRYCIPDSNDGTGTDASLSLYITGRPRMKMPMTSRYCYLYGNYPFNHQPGSGSPRHFWDEARMLVGQIHKGDVVRIQKDADDSASEYLIDFIDLESVPAAIERPGGSVSVIDFGARAEGGFDNRPAFELAIAAGKRAHESVWIPPGNFTIEGPISLSDVAIHGAGMWYTTLAGVDDYRLGNRVAVLGTGSNVTMSDFAIVGKLRYRNDAEPNDGIGGSFGTGSVLRNLWVEHTKTGAWLTNSDGLLVEGCRFRNTIADGVNLCVGMRNTVVKNCTARGTGDDCFAIWPADYAKSVYRPGQNRIENCTGQLNILGQGFAVYGGESNQVLNCGARDICYGAGILASTTFPTESGFHGLTQFRNIELMRTGNDDGAIGTVANLRDLAGLRFENIEAIDNITDGIKFASMNGHVLSDTAFRQITIQHSGTGGWGCGIEIAVGAKGSAKLSQSSVVDSATVNVRRGSSAFTLEAGAGAGNRGLAADK